MNNFIQIKNLKKKIKENYKLYLYYMEISKKTILDQKQRDEVYKIYDDATIRYKKLNNLLLELSNITHQQNLLKNNSEKYNFDIKLLIILIILLFIISIILTNILYNYLLCLTNGVILTNIITLLIGAVNYFIAFETYKNVRHKDKENKYYKENQQELKRQYMLTLSKINNEMYLFEFWSKQLANINKSYSNEPTYEEFNVIDKFDDTNINSKKYIKKRKNLL